MMWEKLSNLNDFEGKKSDEIPADKWCKQFAGDGDDDGIKFAMCFDSSSTPSISIEIFRFTLCPSLHHCPLSIYIVTQYIYIHFTMLTI